MGRSSPEYIKAYYEANRDKIREAARIRAEKWRRDDPNRAKKSRRKFLAKQRGLTIEQYEAMLQAHDQRCAICKKHENEVRHGLCIDHDHESGVVRGLLCHSCNLSLGKFQDSLQLLKSAVDYLSRFKVT